MARRVIARFVGTNREFKKYLETLKASEVVNLDARGKLPRIKLGRTVRFPLKQVTELLENPLKDKPCVK